MPGSTTTGGRSDRLPPTAWGPAAAPRSPETATPTSEVVRKLQGQCGVAVIALIVFHVYQFCNTTHFLYFGTPAYGVLNSLDAGVSWLLVIATFLVFEPVARSIIDRGTPIAARRVLWAAAVRVLPTYYIAVVVVWLPRQASLPGDWRDLVEHLTFTQVFDNTRIFWTIGPAWALSAAVWCVALLLGVTMVVDRFIPSSMTRRQRAGLLAVAAAVLATASLAWKVWAFAADGRSTQGSFANWFGPAAVLDNVAVGMGVAIASVALRRLGPLSTRRQAGLYAVALVTLVLAFRGRQPDSWSAVFFGTLCATGFGSLVAATVLGTRRSDPPPRSGRPAPRKRAQQWLAAILLGSYLWHEPVMLALRPVGLVRQAPDAFGRDVLVVITASLLAGWLSYLTIERPVLRLAQHSLDCCRNYDTVVSTTTASSGGSHVHHHQQPDHFR